ncbi:hypothetical protein BDFB_010499 [Asbolus verrucosus]|uniref:Uncharacterized protein n=1 Tax=Asbolus verrucosus TaxID=1661398 RepID=A0A482VIE1_ASBVE|nr:hypothetical protein BDFB_010499 [Asbolus verrucosus]
MELRNPHFFIETPQHPRKVGVWVAVGNRRIIGPYRSDGNINAVRYREELLTPFLNKFHDDELIFGYF